MNFKFWLLQGLGWLPYALLQLLLNSEDQPRDTAEHLVPAVVLVLMAVAASLLLRALYRWVRPRGWGALRWLGLVLLASLGLAASVDALFQGGLGVLAQLWPALVPLHEAQPMLARAPMLAIMYLLWSLLYLVLSGQQRLELAAAAEQRLQLALKEAQVQRLLGQLSPHFIFNTLNNIRALILKDAEAARTLLTKFAATLRYQFTDQESAEVSLEEELKTVHDYLDLVRLQLGARLHFEQQIEPATLALAVPRFALQLLVENAIKHGLAPRPGPGWIRISARLAVRALELEVRNTGVLGDRAASQGIGLKNLEQRLQLRYANGASLQLSQSGDEVLAQLRLERAA